MVMLCWCESLEDQNVFTTLLAPHGTVQNFFSGLRLATNRTPLAHHFNAVQTLTTRSPNDCAAIAIFLGTFNCERRIILQLVLTTGIGCRGKDFLTVHRTAALHQHFVRTSHLCSGRVLVVKFFSA